MSDALAFHRAILSSRHVAAIAVAIGRDDFPVAMQSAVLADFEADLSGKANAADIARSLLARDDLTGETILALFRAGWSYRMTEQLPVTAIPGLIAERICVDEIARVRLADIPAQELPALCAEAEYHESLARLCSHPEAGESLLVAAYKRILSDLEKGLGSQFHFNTRTEFNHNLAAVIEAPAFPAAKYRDEILTFGSVPVAAYARRSDLALADISEVIKSDSSNIVCHLIVAQAARLNDDQWRDLSKKWLRSKKEHAGNVLVEIAKHAPANIRDELFTAGAALSSNPNFYDWFMGDLIAHGDFSRWDEINMKSFGQTRAALKNPNVPERLFLPIVLKGHDRFSAEIAIENPNFPAALREHPAFAAAFDKKAAEVAAARAEAISDDEFGTLLSKPCPQGRLPDGLSLALRRQEIPVRFADAILNHPEPEVRLRYIGNASFPLDRISDFLAGGFNVPLRMDEPEPPAVASGENESDDFDGEDDFADDDNDGDADDADDGSALEEKPTPAAKTSPIVASRRKVTPVDDFSDLPLFAAA